MLVPSHSFGFLDVATVRSSFADNSGHYARNVHPGSPEKRNDDLMHGNLAATLRTTAVVLLYPIAE